MEDTQYMAQQAGSFGWMSKRKLSSKYEIHVFVRFEKNFLMEVELYEDDSEFDFFRRIIDRIKAEKMESEEYTPNLNKLLASEDMNLYKSYRFEIDNKKKLNFDEFFDHFIKDPPSMQNSTIMLRQKPKIVS